MSTRIYVSTLEASYFETQLLGYTNNPPTEGVHTVGDIVLSSVQQNDVLGWVCVKAGNPGEWKVICDIVNVKNSINQNKNDISKLAGRVTKNEADIREINIDILNLNKNVEDNNSDLEDRINENANNISNLRIDVDVNKGNIKNNLNSINDLRTQIEDAKKTLNNVGNQANINSDDIANIERELLEIGNRLDNTDSNNTDLLNRIQNELNILKNNVGKEGTTNTPATGIYKELNNLQKEDENINKEINNIKELIDGNEAINNEFIEVLQKEIDDIKDAIIELQKEIDDIKDDIAELRKEINDIKDDIAELQKGVADNKDDIAELQKGVEGNKTELDDLKQGLIDSLKEKNIDVKDNISWKELFGLLLQGLVKPEEPEEPEKPDEPIDIPCTNITLNNTTIHFTEKGVTSTIVPTLYPNNTTEKVVWSTNNNAVATVNNGVVTSVGQGDCTITARCGSVSASCYVTVDISKDCSRLEFDIDELVLNVGETRQVQLIVEPTDCTDVVGYKLSKDGIVYVNNYVASTKVFTIRGMKAGNVTLNVTCGTKDISLNITVNPIEDPIEILINEITIKVGETYDATKLYNLQEGYVVQYKYSSVIAIEDDHTIVGKEVGTTNLEIICGEIIKNVKVNVIEAPEINCQSISLNKSSLNFTSLNDTQTLTATPTPSNTTDTVSWSSSNTSIATVTQFGLVTSIGKGSCTITATCGSKSATCTVTVNIEEPIEILIDEITIEVGETYDATRLYKLQAGYNVQYKYTSIIAIEGEHIIHGKEVGTTNLEIRCGDIIKNVKVNVIEAPEINCQSISLNKSSLSFTSLNATQTLTATLTPSNTTDTVSWRSSNNNVATVNSSGVVTSKANGSCTITATCGSKSATCNVTVNIEEPIEILIDEITIRVNERYDATRLYNLQEGYNVQYKYTSIISIEGEHTIVGKEVGTTNLEIICGEIIKNVKVNVI